MPTELEIEAAWAAIDGVCTPVLCMSYLQRKDAIRIALIAAERVRSDENLNREASEC